MLNEMNHVPEELLTAKAEDLLDILKAPTLIHLEGANPQPLFICTLLHGNETTGFYAIQQLLKKYKEKTLPRAISIFIGNITAAKEGQRRLDSQDDYNRIWPGSHHSDSAEKDMMQIVTSIMKKRNRLPALIYTIIQARIHIMAVLIYSTLMVWYWLRNSVVSLFILQIQRVCNHQHFLIFARLSFSNVGKRVINQVKTMRFLIWKISYNLRNYLRTTVTT
jgi:hypothetical protein